MKTLPIIPLDVEPDFDFATFLFLAQIDQLGPREMLLVLDIWEKWRPLLKIHQLGERKGHVLVYLEEPVEKEIDAIWKTSPSEGFKHEAIAQTMIMGTLKSLMPELGEKECAPVPEPTKPLRRTVEKLGLTMHESGALSRKYATITPYPHRYGCERCHLKDTCIKNMNLDLSGLVPTPGTTSA
ncbi:MAG: hypothetical protein EOL86_04905 [Deltaproteobacteria bacterium]|nr:hypothetical protein [Deltaproteobacteria bacterium]